MTERLEAWVRCPYCYRLAAAVYLDGSTVRVDRYADNGDNHTDLLPAPDSVGDDTEGRPVCVDPTHTWAVSEHDLSRVRGTDPGADDLNGTAGVLKLRGKKI